MLKKKGFTLIEMLVVVLIIGIIAAIAFPQYQLSVLKTRYTQLMIMGEAIRRAQDAYYLANGRYALSLNELDLTIPGNCIPTAYDGGLRCDKFVCVVYDGWGGSESSGNVYCTMDMQDDKKIYYMILPLRPNSKRYCGTAASSELGKKLCENLGGIYGRHGNGIDYYQL